MFCYFLFSRQVDLPLLSYTVYSSPKPLAERRQPLPKRSCYFPCSRQLYRLLLPYTFDCLPIFGIALQYCVLISYTFHCFNNRICGFVFSWIAHFPHMALSAFLNQKINNDLSIDPPTPNPHYPNTVVCLQLRFTKYRLFLLLYRYFYLVCFKRMAVAQ